MGRASWGEGWLSRKEAAGTGAGPRDGQSRVQGVCCSTAGGPPSRRYCPWGPATTLGSVRKANARRRGKAGAAGRSVTFVGVQKGSPAWTMNRQREVDGAAGRVACVCGLLAVAGDTSGTGASGLSGAGISRKWQSAGTQSPADWMETRGRRGRGAQSNAARRNRLHLLTDAIKTWETPRLQRKTGQAAAAKVPARPRRTGRSAVALGHHKPVLGSRGEVYKRE